MSAVDRVLLNLRHFSNTAHLFSMAYRIMTFGEEMSEQRWGEERGKPFCIYIKNKLEAAIVARSIIVHKLQAICVALLETQSANSFRVYYNNLKWNVHVWRQSD